MIERDVLMDEIKNEIKELIAVYKNATAEHIKRDAEWKIEQAKREADLKAELAKKNDELKIELAKKNDDFKKELAKKEAKLNAELKKKNDDFKKELAKKEAKLNAELKKSNDEINKKLADSKAELDAAMKRAMDSFHDLRGETKGIGESNGMYSEAFFYNSLGETMTFCGVKFDFVDSGLKRKKSMPDGKKITGEYDVVMVNCNTVAIIEVKYRVRTNDLDSLVNKQVSNFKILYPQYANYMIYLGIAGMSFDKGAEEKAKDYGIGILKHGGDNLIIEDKHVRVY